MRITNDKINSKSIKQRTKLGLLSMAMLGIPSLVNAADHNFIANARLPADVKLTCTADIEPWFFTGKVSGNGWVKPANSLNPIFKDFKNNSLCDFYKWGSQMFLWLTSREEGRHVFNTSPTFYNLSVESHDQREFLTGEGPMLMTARKSKVDDEIELGQAGNNDALISQQKSLVYYGLHANDVFAVFTTQQKQGALKNCDKRHQQCLSKGGKDCYTELKACKISEVPQLEFPNTQSQLDDVVAFAKRHGYPLGDDKNALAIELKTSWVDAGTLKDPGRYILSQAIVPTFTRSPSKGPWDFKKNEEKTLAMVGMHVVGTVNSHPEMVWSTFEHVDNVPDNTYIYQASGGEFKTLDFNSNDRDWTFLPNGATQPRSIIANAQVKTDAGGTSTQKIASQNGRDIGATDVFRADPWGNLHGSKAGSPQVDNNTDLASINVSVLSQLAIDDVRGNYIQTGGIWTAQGEIPSDGTDKALRGSLNLANTTLETFYQIPKTGFKPKNCFGCHGNDPKNATSVSHIFDAMKPLQRR